MSHYPSAAQDRRTFLKILGLSGGAIGTSTLLVGCDQSDPVGPDPTPGTVVLDFSDDFGVLNYALVLEQLEYAFYEAVLAGGYFASASGEERTIMQDFHDHELAHVDFLNTAIPALGGTAIPQLEFDFSNINFGNRQNVLTVSAALEDTGVSAYNGAGQYLTNPDLLTIAGKIVSVEARHASAVRAILNPNDRQAFAGPDVVDSNGLDLARTPAEVAGIAAGFIRTPLELRNVPM